MRRGGAPCNDGQRLAVYIVPEAGFEVFANEIRAYVKRNLAKFSVPRDVVFLDELPRNPAGKVLTRELPAPGRTSRSGLVGAGSHAQFLPARRLSAQGNQPTSPVSTTLIGEFAQRLASEIGRAGGGAPRHAGYLECVEETSRGKRREHGRIMRVPDLRRMIVPAVTALLGAVAG